MSEDPSTYIVGNITDLSNSKIDIYAPDRINFVESADSFLNIPNYSLTFKKTHPDAKLPESINPDDTGYDVFSVEDAVIPARDKKIVDIGLEFANIPPGFWVRVEGRSGLSFKHSIIPHFGILDNGYRGNCGILLYNHSNKDYEVKKGDKIAQLVIYPLVKILDVKFSEEKTETKRGSNGFGSSGR